MTQMKKIFNTFIGSVLVFLGLIFILIPGPAIIFLPLGLALLSLEYDWAKSYLKRCQRWMRTSAKYLDNCLMKMRNR